MKAFLLAAGKGTRLEPLTLQIPKCLISISGKPLIEYWFDLFALYGVTEVLINTSHLAEKVRNYIDGHSRGLRIKLTYEHTLLGSGGTIKKNWDFVEGEKAFFILYADNLTNVNLRKMQKYHMQHNKDFTIALFKVPNPIECGIVELDGSSTVVSFVEKPVEPASDLAFAGIMISGQSLKDFWPERETFDLGYDVLPNIAGKASGYVIDEYLLDIGTPDKLYKAEKDIKSKIFK